MRPKRARVEMERNTELFWVVFGRHKGGQVAYLDTFLSTMFGEKPKPGDVFQFTVEKNPKPKKGRRPC